MIGLLHGEVHLELHLLIGVLQVHGGDEVLLLEVRLGQVVHGLRVLLPAPPLPDVAHPHQHQAEQQQEHRRAHPQAHRRPAQGSRRPGVLVAVGWAGGDVHRHVPGPAAGPAVARRAEAGGRPRRPAGDADDARHARPAVEASLEGAAVSGLGAVAARVARGAGA